MPYYKSVTVEGDVVQVKKYYAKKHRTLPEYRNKKSKPTSEEIAAVNQKNAERKLTSILNANFKEGDGFVTLTYSRNLRPKPDVARKYTKKFLRQLRRLYRQEGAILKYVLVTEYESTSIHHHLVLNSIEDVNLVKMISKIWPYGSVDTKALYSMEYSQLAAYIIKETSKTFQKDDGGAKQRYSCSRNLVRPVPMKTVISRAETWLKRPRAPKGYFIPEDLCYEGTDFAGNPYQRYTMLKLTAGRPPTYLSLEEQKRWYEKIIEEDPHNREAKKRLEIINEKGGLNEEDNQI